MNTCRVRLAVFACLFLFFFCRDAPLFSEDKFIPHVGQWKGEGNRWETTGEIPPGGWYLRARQQYHLQSLRFDVRKEGDGYVFIYTRNWRIFLDADKVTARYQGLWGKGKPPYRHWPYYLWTASRLNKFEAGKNYLFELKLNGECLSINWDGQELLRWHSPKEEWQERIQKSGRIHLSEQYKLPDSLPAEALNGKDEIVVLHALDTRASFSNIQVEGTDAGPAQGFLLGTPSTPYVRPDFELERLAPSLPVDVEWSLEPAETKVAEALPAVSEWAITEFVDPKEHWGDKLNQPLRTAKHLVGAEEPGLLPNILLHHYKSHAYMEGAQRMPQPVSIYFNLKEAGEYTFQIGWGTYGLGWGPNVLEIQVDGKPVSREVYRALCQWRPCPEGRDYVPLKLKMGPHRIDVELNMALVKTEHYLMKYLCIPIQFLRLVKGIHEPLLTFKASDTQRFVCRPEALSAPQSLGEVNGKMIHYRISDLPPGEKYKIMLGFYDVDVNKPGLRRMDVSLNGKPAEKELDVVKEVGWCTDLERIYPVNTQAMRPEGYVPAWTARKWGKDAAPEIGLSENAHSGKFSLRMSGGSDSGLLSDEVLLNQKEKTSIVIRYVARMEKAVPDAKRLYTFGITLKHVTYMDGKVEWQAFNSQLGINPTKEGWQTLEYVWTPPKPIKSIFFFLGTREDATVFIDDLRAVELAEGQNVEEALTAGRNLVPNGDFEALDHYVDIKLVGKNFKAFLNSIRIEDQNGKVVYQENCGWSTMLANKKSYKAYHPRPELRPREEPKEWTPADTFDGHNLVANPHFSLKDDRGRPAWWYSLREFRMKNSQPYPKQVIATVAPSLSKIFSDRVEFPNTLSFYNILPGDGEFTHDASDGYRHAGSMKIEKTDKDFGITCNWPSIDYGKRQEFSFWAKCAGAGGKVFPEILWFSADMNSDMKYHDQTSALHTPRLQLMGSTKGEDAITGTSDWKRLSIKTTPPFGAVFAALAIRVEENRSGTVWVDDAEFGGYGAESLEITASFLGYHPKSDKQIVIKSLQEAPVQCSLVTASGKSVKAGEASYHSYDPPTQRYYYTFDFTSQEGEGWYQCVATQSGRQVSSGPFNISRDAYRKLSKIALHGLHFKRMNCAIPGAHEPEALEDANMLASLDEERFCMYERLFLPDRVDMLGGYYDAGDDIKHVEYWPSVLFATSRLLETIRPTFNDRTSNDCLDELLWAHRAFPKYQAPDGNYHLGTKPQVRGLDNIPFYSNDRYVVGVGPLPQAAGVAARGSLLLKDLEPVLSDRLFNSAVRNYEFNRFWQRTSGELTTEKFLMAAKGLYAEIYLARLTGEAKYLERMNHHARLLATGLNQRLYRTTDELYRASHHDGNILQDFVWTLCHLLKEYPHHPERDPVVASLKAFVAHVRQVSAIDPWGQARSLSAEEGMTPARMPSAERPIGYWPMLAHSLAEIGMLLKDESIIRLAERQLQWCLGKNMSDLSMIHGVGERVVAGGTFYFLSPEFLQNWMKSERKLFTFDGMVPTMAFRDTGDGNVKWQPGDNYDPPLYGHPRGYVRYYLQPHYPIHPGPTEYYLPQTAHFAIAAATIHQALESLGKE
ncbi:MAG: glycoside hydrolase family 9 protein [Planctomycetota bacterium]|nr:glycoside hydrolase family 9 protein [Planctomycetota bacterium]